jgi:hypothetical protein
MALLPAVVPLLDCALGAAALYWSATPRLTRRESALVAATLATGWLILGTELLSLFHAIRFWPVLAWWLAPLPLLGVHCVRQHARRPLLKLPWPSKIADRGLLAAIVAVLALALCAAWVSPPNNVDSQEYHLQRQVFWAQQRSVEHFPASNLRQVAMPPLTEFAGLTLMVLTGNDRAHNLVQWAAFVLTLFAVSLTTRRFGGSTTAQLLAALWTATIPLAFLQAATTKNDVVVALWLCLLAYWVLLLDTRSRLRWPHVALIGVAFGSLLLTKGTGLIFGLPIGALAAVILLRRCPRVAVGALVAIGGLALAFNAGHLVRNYRAFGSVAPDSPGIHDGPPVGNGDHSLGAVASNLARNLGSHCVTPSAAWNEGLTAAMRALHEKLGRSIDDPLTTWLPGGRFRPYDFWQNDEDKAAAPAHLLLTLLLPLAMFGAGRPFPWRAALSLMAAAIVGLVLFSFLLRWQNWHVRLVVALPALLAPVFGWCFAARRLRFVAPFAALLLLATLAPSVNSFQRPLWGPKNIFQADPLAVRCYYHPNWAAEYRLLVERVKKMPAATIGFFTGASSPDYPMQRLLLDELAPPPTFAVFNATLQIPGKPEIDPDMVIVARSNQKRLQHQSTGTWYAATERIGRYTLFLKESAR